jgi:hypothetical protein
LPVLRLATFSYALTAGPVKPAALTVTTVPWTSSQTTVNAAAALPGVPSGSAATRGRIWLPVALAFACPEARIAPAGETTR